MCNDFGQGVSQTWRLFKMLENCVQLSFGKMICLLIVRGGGYTP